MLSVHFVNAAVLCAVNVFPFVRSYGAVIDVFPVCLFLFPSSLFL